MKKHFIEELVIAKEVNENFESSTRCWTCNNTFVEGNVKVRGYCHVTGTYKGTAHRDINVSLNCQVSIVFQNLNDDDAHLIMLELHKFEFKTNVIPN